CARVPYYSVDYW
nr:immunoglobulin heavy chain junction region [Macaca mulatta]